MVDIFNGTACLLTSSRLLENAIADHSLMLAMFNLWWLSCLRLLFYIFSVAAPITRLRPRVNHLDFLQAAAHHSIIRVLIGANQVRKVRVNIDIIE